MSKKIVFFGTPDFAVPSLDAIVKAGYDVAAVVTATDKPAGRGHGMLQSAVKKYALEHGIDVLQPEKLRDEAFVNRLREIDADLFVVIAFRMMPEVVWAMPRLGTFNLHASLLPRYRGAAPINWAVINGDKETGVTTFFLSHEIDTGAVIDRVAIPISDADDAGSVHDRLMELGATLTVNTVNAIFAGTAKAIPQSEIAPGEVPTPAPKIFKETCHVDWNKPAESIHNLVRGLSPYPGAWSTLTADNVAPADIKIFATAQTELRSASEPGTVHISDGKLLVDTADRQLEILRLQAPGKRRLEAADWLRGVRLTSPRFS
ncbi:MAG: methionyl-tRNA formyltransferase [Candidatus Amulumruptor caecigallinarius]|nr:methionyl-tRNA formyltransferase [Candidatus Amulumruptor caecigallinarius]MCM1396585.1 methionyl-tRNA formyltransferase [Candidatus Amulumruptor caecigallinarius]MCM1453357.1 methionyl-tRNA formyltransferase [bacterium]